MRSILVAAVLAIVVAGHPGVLGPFAIAVIVVGGLPALLSPPAGVLQVTGDTASDTLQHGTTAGKSAWTQKDSTGATKVEYTHWGSASTPTNGMTAGWAGVNTQTNVGYTIGVGNAVRMTFDPTTGLVGVGKAPTATKGMLQLLGSANGGIDPSYFGYHSTNRFAPVFKAISS